MGQILVDHKKVHIRQKLSALECISANLCKISNRFTIHAMNPEDPKKPGPVLMTGKEDSECWDRCCCSPHHSLLMHFSPAWDPNRVLMTMERPGCGCCCGPKPCLNMMTCGDPCREEVILHAGHVTGRAGSVENPNPVMTLTQPKQCCSMNGGCTPTIDIADTGNASVPHAQIKGPTCFGGCAEFCCENHFKYESVGGGQGSGQGSGEIVHLTPKTCWELFCQCCTDVDNYHVNFAGGAGPIDKANMVAASVLIDYMFFEVDNGLCSYDPENKVLYITVTLCFCWGALIPCNICIPLSSGDGAPPSPEDAVGAPPAPETAVAPETL